MHQLSVSRTQSPSILTSKGSRDAKDDNKGTELDIATQNAEEALSHEGYKPHRKVRRLLEMWMDILDEDE